MIIATIFPIAYAIQGIGVGDTDIGYNVFNGTVVIWNEVAPYYFNESSGIQFTNNYEDYWTRNIFCGGYKNASNDWVYTCNDAYNFTQSLKTDNQTYVNYTLWKDINISGKEARIGIRYSLRNNDSNMTIEFSVENTGDTNINSDLGFAWRVKDIKIGGDTANDNIKAPNVVYHLDEPQNQSITDAGYYQIYDANTGKYLYLDWDEDLTEVLKIENKSGQYNAPVTLGIKIGTLNIGQTKSTKMYWYDAVSYISSGVLSTDDLNNPVTTQVTTSSEICNYVFIAGVSVDSEPTAYVSSLTTVIDGTTYGLSKIGNISSSDGEIQAELWNFTKSGCLDAGTYNFTATFGNPSKEEASLGVMAIEGVASVNLTSVKSTSTAGGTSLSLTMDVAQGQMAVDVIGVDFDAPPSASGDNTRRVSYDEGAHSIGMSTGTYTDGTTDMSWDSFNDEAAQVSVTLIEFTDTIPPSISNPAVNTTSVYTGNSFCVNATVVDTGGSGLDVVYAEIWNTTNYVNYTMTNAVSPCSTGGSTYSAQITPTIAGNWNYSKTFANDTDGNSNTSDFTDLTVLVNQTTYLLNITAPLTASPYSVTDGTNITINFTYKRNGVAITSDVTMNNITIGGQYCTFVDVVAENEEWTQFMANLNKTGYTTNTAPANISQGMNFFNTSGAINSAPAVTNGYVYVGSASNYLYQFNASNISIMIANFSTTSDIDSSPAIANGYVYFGGYDSFFYQLNASNVSQQIAKFDSISAITYSSPAVANGYVYIGGLANILFQLNATDVSINTANFTTAGDIISSPAVANGYVYIGSNDNKLYQLNATDISINYYNFTTVGDVRSAPAIANNYVYIVGGNVVGNSFVYQLNASNISQMIANYSLPADSNPAGSIAVAYDYVYVGDDTTLYQLNASDLTHVANLSKANQFRSSPTVADNYVYVGCYDNKIYQLNALNISQEIASFTTGGTVRSSPAIASGYIYIGSFDGALRQLGTGGTQTSLEYDSTNNNWKVNCTVPSGLSGLQDLLINASYSTDTSTDTEPNSISYPVSDSVYPKFSIYWDNNASLIDSGLGLFNVTVSDTNGTIFLEINGNNISAHNLTADMYNASYSFSSGGDYTYKWIGYGNGTNSNINESALFTYVVNSSSSCTYTSGDWNVDCSDYCVISSDVTIDTGSNIYLTGTGNFTINDGVKIKGWTYLKAVDTCYIKGLGTGNFYY